jgi:NADH:ubiquinone oxidoreductase subunit F (NADH-binding)/NADH:ubiquinone oxidoreductase subunit E
VSTASSDDVGRALAAFPRERQWLLPALHAVQHACGWLPEPALAEVAAHLRVPASEVYGVASHYPEFRLAPRGRHHVRVCTGVPCTLLGGQALLETLARARGVKPGETGAERPLTLEAVDCLFACSMAPIAEIDGVMHGRLIGADLSRVDGWLRNHPATSEASRAAASRAAEAPAPVVAASADAARSWLVEQARGRQRGRPALRLLVQTGTCADAVGASDVLHALRAALGGRAGGAEVVAGACSGACYAAPSVMVPAAPAAPGPFLIERLSVAAVPAFLEQLEASRGDFTAAGLRGVVWAETAWRGLTPALAHPFWRQERVVLEGCGVLDPESLDDALLAGGYGALARALDSRPEEVIEAVRASGLQGRGGAFFPTALKWEACRKATGAPKYVVMNGEEGEPGIFKDRHIMEGVPHRVLEGVLLAAYAAGASRAVLYVHGEADLSARRLAHAVVEAEAAGILGEQVLGRAFACRVEIRRGAGGFVLGEETALLESIEGRRAQPRTRPPFPVEAGLFGRPTVINNVETLATVPAIVARGGAWFAALGTAKAPGPKIFGLSGPLHRPGVVEVRNGITLGQLLHDIGGGCADGRTLVGALVGGPSGSVVPAALFETPMEPRGQVSPGTGGVTAMPAGASVADVVKALVAFNARESCGKCTPCREGLPRLQALIEQLGASPEAEARALPLAESIQLASLCGLGQAAPLALLRGLEAFGPQLRRPA